MFPLQRHLCAAQPTLHALFGRYAFPTEKLDQLAAQAEHFVVRVPVVGSFSAGKSTLLNALLGERLLGVGVDPETSVPAELRYAAAPRYLAQYADGRTVPLTAEHVQHNADHLADLRPDGYLQVGVPAERLAALPHLCLVDMPGWGAGSENHGKAIGGYVWRSLAYCVVVSAEEGCLHDSLKTALAELKLDTMPVIVIITKADKKPAAEIDQVMAQVGEAVRKIIGDTLLAVVSTTAGRKVNIDAWFTALTALEAKAETIFTHAVARPWAETLQLFDQRLTTLQNPDKMDAEKIRLAQEEVRQKMVAFNATHRHQTQKLAAQAEAALPAIVQGVENRLTAQLDSLTRAALDGGSVNGQIAEAVRLGITEGLHYEFESKVQAYLKGVSDSLPSYTMPNLVLDASGVSEGVASEAVSGVGKFVANVLVHGLLSKFPVLKVLTPVVDTLINALFGSKAPAESAAAQAAERSDHARRHLRHTVFPEVLSHVRRHVGDHLSRYVRELNAQTAAEVQAQSNLHQATLATLQAEQAEGEAAFAAKCVQYRADQATLQQLLAPVRLALAS